MKKHLIALTLAFVVVLSLNSTFIASAIDGIAADDTVQPMDLLNETFIEHDYETGEETTFTYADVVDSLREIDPEYTDYTEPFHADSIISDSLDYSEGSDLQTLQPGSSINLVWENEAPYSHTVRIVTTYDNGNTGHGTGFMISKYVVLTCAHLIYGDDIVEIRIYPLNDEEYPPIASGTTYYHPRSWVLSSNYTNTTDSEVKAKYDWCYLTLHDPLGEDIGYYSFTQISNLTLGLSVTLTGYPLELDGFDGFVQRAQYYSQGRLTVLNTYRVKHTCSSEGSHSGSPVFKAGNQVVAIHTGGGDVNYGVRITTTLYNLLTNKISEVG